MTITQAQLPYQAAPAALARAAAAATVAAAIALVVFVLPAEWGIDPTGLGKALDLTRMAEGTEDEIGDPAEASAAPDGAQDFTVPVQNRQSIETATPWRDDEKEFTLPPHSGTEFKAHMQHGDRFIFRWSASGPVRMDMHAEPEGAKEGEFTSFWKQKDLAEAQGSYIAAFAGTHGWYLRNGGETPVTVKLKVSGFYRDLFEPPAS